MVVATGARPARPSWAGDHRRVVDVRDVLEGRAHPQGSVVVVDELGFHQATSVAELLADRGCRVEIVTNGMVVGQDLGITLDMETWNVKAHAKGIVQSVDLVPMGVSRSCRYRPAVSRPEPAGELVLTLQHHPTADRGAACLRLDRVQRPPGSGRRAVARRSRTGRFPSTGSVTAWLPAGPMPPSSRDTGWRWRCEPEPSNRRWPSCSPGTGGCRWVPTRRWPKPEARRWSSAAARSTAAGALVAATRVAWAETGEGFRPAELTERLAPLLARRRPGDPAGVSPTVETWHPGWPPPSTAPWCPGPSRSGSCSAPEQKKESSGFGPR